MIATNTDTLSEIDFEVNITVITVFLLITNKTELLWFIIKRKTATTTVIFHSISKENQKENCDHDCNIPFLLVHNQKENCDYDCNIPFHFKGNENLIY